MKNSTKKSSLKTQFEDITCSKFHEKVRTIFRTEMPFKLLRCYQEVNVQDLFPAYFANGHHYDWYIKELNLIIELHGTQHYKATAFGAMSYEEKQRNFYRQQDRDNSKKTIALEHGVSYIEIPYDKNITLEKILKHIGANNGG